MLRQGVRLAAVVAVVSLVATLAFAVGTLASRPLENTEGSLLFEASRLHAGLDLYTDPVVGARDYGPVPARYHVLYPPLFSRAIGLLPVASEAPVARVAGAVAWFGVLAWIALGARRRGRPLGVLAAAFVAGVYTLALYGASARPDPVAVAIAGVALERCARARRAGALDAGLFAVAAWLKPNVLGLGAGAMVQAIAAPVVGGFAVVSAAIAAPLYHASKGELLRHLAATTLQPLSAAQWADQMSTRAPFFALLLGFALYAGAHDRADRGVRIATVALAASVALTLVSLAKIGSTTCYFMEPCLGAVVVLAHARPPPVSSRLGAALAVAAPLQALYTGVASVRSSVEALSTAPAKDRALAVARAALRPGELWLSDDAGVELALDGRLVDTPFQTTELVRRGLFPEEVWLADLDSPEIVGVVATSDVLDRPLEEVDRLHDRYDVRLRAALRARFAPARREAGYSFYVRR